MAPRETARFTLPIFRFRTIMLLITGATGRSGRHIVQHVLRDRRPARVITRSPERAQELKDQGLEALVGDLADSAFLRQALQGVERALLLAANHPGQLAQELDFIQTAADCGVQHLVKMSAIGADPDARAVLKRWHGESEERLRQATSMSHAIVRPSFFMDNLLNSAPGIARDGRLELPMGTGRVGCIDIRDVAEAIYRALTRTDVADGTFLITGPELLSFGDMARILSAILGREVRYVDQPPDAFRHQLRQLGVPAWNVDAMLELFELIRGDHNALLSDEFETLTGRPPQSFEQFAQDHAAAFQ